MWGVHASVFRTIDWTQIVLKLADNCLVHFCHLSYRLEWLLHLLTWKDKYQFGPQGAEELFMTTNEAKILLPNEQVASDYCRIYYEVDLSKESCDRVAVKFSLHLPSQITPLRPVFGPTCSLFLMPGQQTRCDSRLSKCEWDRSIIQTLCLEALIIFSDSISDGVTGSKKKELG